MDKNFKNQENRINMVFQNKTEDFSKRMETIEIYKEFLDQNLSYPIVLTGIEDFDWEEYYVFGPGSKKEYENLKKTNPSYTDTFELEKIDDRFDEDYGGRGAIGCKAPNRICASEIAVSSWGSLMYKIITVRLASPGKKRSEYITHKFS